MNEKILPPCATETVDNVQCIHYPGKLQECFDCGIIHKSHQTSEAVVTLNDLLIGAEAEILFKALFLCVKELGWDMALAKPKNDDDPVHGMVAGTAEYVDKMTAD